MEGTVLFPGVRGGVCENLVTEAHSLLQHLDGTRTSLNTNSGDTVVDFPLLYSKQSFNDINNIHSPLSSYCRQ